MFHKTVAAATTFRVKDVSKKEERKGRPVGLNTVNMLKVIIFVMSIVRIKDIILMMQVTYEADFANSYESE